MSAANPGGGYGHRIVRNAGYGGDREFRISWKYDKYFLHDRCRYPRHIVRYTNRAGAERFAKKWSIPMPPEK